MSWGFMSRTKLNGRDLASPAGMLTSYLMAVKLRMIAAEAGASSGSGWVVLRLPPTNAISIGPSSWFLISTRARVARPLTSLTPKMSASGKTVSISACNSTVGGAAVAWVRRQDG